MREIPREKALVERMKGRPFVILGVDAVADMGRTAINVAGNCLASVIVAKWEGVFEEESASPVVLQGMAD